ncbi:hypothetical protein G6F65_022042 [Rhizopus arrhizus]|nr:hypothetical protein G6F65_022042 [Rhizopus arrhizus]
MGLRKSVFGVASSLVGLAGHGLCCAALPDVGGAGVHRDGGGAVLAYGRSLSGPGPVGGLLRHRRHRTAAGGTPRAGLWRAAVRGDLGRAGPRRGTAGPDPRCARR